MKCMYFTYLDKLSGLYPGIAEIWTFCLLRIKIIWKDFILSLEGTCVIGMVTAMVRNLKIVATILRP